MANCVDPDQMLQSVASDLGLYCLQRPVPILRVIMVDAEFYKQVLIFFISL